MRWIAVVFTVGLIAAPPASASAVKLGGTAPPGTAAGCAGCTVFQKASGAGSPSYVVPQGGGTITSWSVQGSPSTLDCLATKCVARLQVLRPEAGQYALAAQSAQQTVPAGKLSTFSTSIPVRAGDVLGLNGTQVPLKAAAGPDDVVGTVTGVPAAGSLLDGLPIDTSNGLVNVSVTLDPTIGAPGGGGGSGGGATSGSAPFAGVAVAGRVVRVSRSGVARIVARCPAAAVGTCAGRLVLRSGRVGLGHAAFRIAAGQRARVNLHVSRKGRKLLRRSGRLAAQASLSSYDGRRQRKVTRASLILKRPGR